MNPQVWFPTLTRLSEEEREKMISFRSMVGRMSWRQLISLLHQYPNPVDLPSKERCEVILFHLRSKINSISNVSQVAPFK